MSRKEHHHGNLSCSFCGKGQREVRKLIAGPTVYICDECIRLCNDIIAEEAERIARVAALARRLAGVCEDDSAIPEALARRAADLARDLEALGGDG